MVRGSANSLSHLLLEELEECLSSAGSIVGLGSVLVGRLAAGQELDGGESGDLELLAEGAVGVGIGLQ